KARVLFTTQKMLEKQSQLRQLSFACITDFYYQGKPRQVRIWDEAIIPSSIFTLDCWKSLKIIPDLRELNADLGNAIYNFVTKTLEQTKDDDVIEMPMFSQYGIGMQDARQAVSDDASDLVEALFNSEGRPVRISKDRKTNTTTIEYQDFL